MVTILTRNEGDEALIQNASHCTGLMGLSVGKLLFQDKVAMRDYAQFLGSSFAQGIFLIADLPKRYNIMAIDEVSKETAQRRALLQGDNQQRMLQKLIQSIPNVTVTRWSDFQTPSYRDNLSVLRAEYAKQVAFRESVDDYVASFMRAHEGKIAGRRAAALAVAKEYVLDELALLTSLTTQFRLPVCQIYPQNSFVEDVLRDHSDIEGLLHIAPSGRLVVRPTVQSAL